MELIDFEKRHILKSGEKVFTKLSLTANSKKEIAVFDGENVDLLIENVENDTELNILVSNNSVLNIAILSKNLVNNLKINAKVKENAKISLYFADFSKGKNKVLVNVDLDEYNASADWHLSSLSANDDDKEFSIFINHNHPFTHANSDNYGVCKDDARLIFSGTSAIYKGNHGSDTHQNAKIMVFDEHSVAIAKPILKIDENDLIASHSAVVGRINEEHLFYLTSRGLPESSAKELITYGYLKPIVEGFSLEKTKEEINNLIEARM